MFKDRIQAGQQLAVKLGRYQGADAVVLAMPRGGVVLGHEVAEALKLPLDIVVTRKVGHPSNPEYAICAVDDEGDVICNEGETAVIDQKVLAREIQKQRTEAKRRIMLYRGDKKPIPLSGKTVIIIDDGVATGLTLKLAIAGVKAKKPKHLVVAVPVIPPDVAKDVEKIVDRLVILEPTDDFLGSVGAYYERFPQVEDEEVIRLLRG